MYISAAVSDGLMLAMRSITADSGISAPLDMKSVQVTALEWSIASIPAIETTVSTLSSDPIVACSL